MRRSSRESREKVARIDPAAMQGVEQDRGAAFSRFDRLERGVEFVLDFQRMTPGGFPSPRFHSPRCASLGFTGSASLAAYDALGSRFSPALTRRNRQGLKIRRGLKSLSAPTGHPVRLCEMAVFHLIFTRDPAYGI